MNETQKTILAVGLILSATVGVCGLAPLVLLTISDVIEEIHDWLKRRNF